MEEDAFVVSIHLQYHPTYLAQNPPKDPALKAFLQAYSQIPVQERTVLELGTKRWFEKPTHHEAIFLPYQKYVKSDVEAGRDVDVVADAHNLTVQFGLETQKVIFASSVWEHLKNPWRAADQLLSVLKPGGIFFIQTHQTFPIHGFPNDYFRFSAEGLKSLFESDDTCSELIASYDYPCKIIPENKELDWNPAAESYLNVNLFGRKK